MATKNLVAWIREEHEKVKDLGDRLREQVAVVPRSNLAAWIAELQNRFEHFRAHVTKHMALEERDGYLPAVVQHRPTLSPEVDRLWHEHVELGQIMEGIDRAMRELGPEDRLLVRDCCRRIDNLLAYIEHHEDLENNLVTYAFTQDIGTTD